MVEQCPTFKTYLTGVFVGDSDAADKFTFALEMMGYSFTGLTNFQKYILLLGFGGNGKSVLLDVLRALIGVNNIASVQPSQFNNRFQLASLDGKRVNLVTELPEGYVMHDAELKGLVVGETTTVEHKFGTPFLLRPVFKLWLCANHLPHTRDFSDAFFRRVIVLTFNRKFTGKTADLHLTDKLLNELPGIAALVLTAFAKALVKESFTEPASSFAIKDEWRLQVDQVQQFVAEQCNPDAFGKVTCTDLYAAYQTWVKACGIRLAITRISFNKRLKVLGYKIDASTNNYTVVRGLTIRGTGGELRTVK